MPSSNISRRNFLKGAAAGAAVAGAVAASDYWGGDYLPPGECEENPYVDIFEGKVFIYPSGEADADQPNIQDVLADPGLPKDIHLMPRTKDGQHMPFKLPCCEQSNSLVVSRDVNIIGQAHPNGLRTIIEGGYIAFECHEQVDPPSLSISKVSFQNQMFGAVYGYFNDFGFDGSEVSSLPMPPPSPESLPMPPPEPGYGLFLENVSGNLQIKNSSITNIGGIVCKGAQNASITNTNIRSTLTSLYLQNVANASIKDNSFDNYNRGLANIILDGNSSMNEIKNGKISGNALFGILILGEGNPDNNKILNVDLKKFGLEKTIGAHEFLSVAAVAIDPLMEGNIRNTVVKAGPGFVSSLPMPPPRGIVIDNGINSSIDKKMYLASEPTYPDIFFDSLSAFRYRIDEPFGIIE